jgi:hypothetical protein
MEENMEKQPYRVTCYSTRGGRLDENSKILWSRNMTLEEYEQYLRDEEEMLERHRARLAATQEDEQ